MAKLEVRGPRAVISRFLRFLSYAGFQIFNRALIYPKTLLTTVALLSVFFTVRIEMMPRYFTMIDNLDPHLPSVQAEKAMERDFKVGQSLFLAFTSLSSQGIPAEAMCLIKTWLYQGVHNLRGYPDVTSVVSPFNVERPVAEGQRLWLAPLLKPSCDQEEPAPAIGFVNGSQEIDGLLASTPWAGLLSAKQNGGDLFVNISFKNKPGMASASVDNDVAFDVDQDLRRLLSAFPDITWHLSGPVAFRAHAKEATNQDMIMNSFIPLVLAVLFRFLYGSWIGGVLIAVALIVMRSFLLGTMALAGYSADPLSGSLILLVSLSAVADFLFVTRYQLQTGANWRHCYKRFLIPSFLTSLTTAVGFACLMSSDIKTVRDLGMWATYGTFLQWAAVYFVLPAIHAVWPRSRVWALSRESWMTRLNDRLAIKNLPSFGRYLVLPILALGMLSMSYLHLEESINSFFPADHAYAKAAKYMQASRNWDGSMSIILKPSLSAPQREGLIKALGQLPEVARIETGGEMVRFLSKDLEALTSQMVERFVTTSDTYKSYFSSTGEERINVYIRESNLQYIEAVNSTVKQHCPEQACYSAGALVIFLEFSNAVIRSLFESFAGSLVIVCSMLATYVWWQRKTCYWAVLASSLWGPFVMTLLMAIFQIPINLVSCFFGAVMVGLAGDNAIQYLYAARHRPLEEGIEARAGGSIEVTICMLAIALMMLTSAFLPPRVLGLVLAAGLLINLGGDLWILKLLLPKKAKSQAAVELNPKRHLVS